MKRRNFLRGSALGLLALPTWLGCAFQKGSSIDVIDSGEVVDNTVGRAFLRAQNAGKPLLVLVIPKDATQRYDRGHAWGELLNYGEDYLWPLALCEVMCANVKEVSELAPVSSEPLFFLLEGAGEGVNVTAYDAKLPSFSEGFSRSGEDDSKGADTRIKMLGELIHKALAADNKMLQARRDFAESILGKTPCDNFAATLQKTGATFDPRFDTYASIAADAMVQKAAPVTCKAQLRAAVESRLKAKKIEGSRWTNSSMCGPDSFEDSTPEEREKAGMYDCGMGFVPEKSTRFLTFITSTEAT